MIAGVVYYHRKEDSLVGQWTHADIGGNLADERVLNVKPGAIEGTWPVEIHTPDGKLMYSGDLTSKKLGSALSLEWNGQFVESKKDGKFIGIGIELEADLIVASFEQISE